MARFDFVSQTGEKTGAKTTSHYRHVTEFRGMDLDTLAKQYALYRQMNALETGTSPSTSSASALSPETTEQPPGLMIRLFGRLASF